MFSAFQVRIDLISTWQQQDTTWKPINWLRSVELFECTFFYVSSSRIHKDRPMNKQLLAILAFAFLAIATNCYSQESKPPLVPAEKPAEGWDQIDDRLIFLMVRLASTETSLEAIDKALVASNRNQSRKTGQAKQADKKNEELDRKGGGPLKWSLFYGRTAESFFYHPTDRNSTYHTTTILSQQSPSNDNQSAAGVPSRQGLPVHQRPPQFDYIYRSNESAKARAEKEIAEMVGKTAELTERKHRLEAEQAGLWCEVAFRSVSHYDLDKKPLYRFEPLLKTYNDTDARVQFETIRSAASFMALALSIVDAAQKDQPLTFSKIKPAVAKARQDLNDSWLRIGVDVTDRKSVEGKFNALAKRLEESASNLSDSYVVALEGDLAKDQQRKDTFRALLQESLIKYAEVILALDEMTALMKEDWKIKPDIDKPIKFVSLERTEASWSFEASPRRSSDAATSTSEVKDFPTPILYLSGDREIPSIPANIIYQRSGGQSVRGKIGMATRFGGNQIAELHCNLPSGNEPRSVAVWLKNNLVPLEKKTYVVFILASQRDESQIGKRFGVEFAGNVGWRFFDNNGGLDSGIPIDTQWHHHSITFDGRHIAYFFDGTRVAKTEKTLSTAVSTFRVGGFGEPPSEYASNFIGDIDELYFFDIALTDSQVNELYLRSTSLSTKKK